MVTNLLKLKLLKNTNEDEEGERRGIEREKIKNAEIVNLIKIYKGYGQADIQILKNNM